MQLYVGSRSRLREHVGASVDAGGVLHFWVKTGRATVPEQMRLCELNATSMSLRRPALFATFGSIALEICRMERGSWSMANRPLFPSPHFRGRRPGLPFHFL